MLLSIVFQCLLTLAQPVQEAYKVLERTFGQRPGNVVFSLVEKSGDTDSYAYEVSSDGILTVEGTSAIALTKGFYDYVLRGGYGISSWTADRLDLPASLPSCPRVETTSPFRNHLFYNVCTYGYTSPFWGWKEWEHELDWLALHGFDMPLSPIAGEAILARVWRGMGLSDEEIGAYFTGPAHFPWMRMGNMTRVDGGMSQEWFDAQIALEHQILDRMKALGMDPVFQGFAGFVPKAIQDHFPGTELIVTHWSGHESYMLDPANPLFSVIGTAFIREWEKEFGPGHFYLIDSFNELDIPFGEQGSRERFDKLAQYSRTIYESLAAANPDAVWVMQGWMFGYQRDIWDPESVRGLLSGAPDDKMSIIDLAVDYNEFVWRSEKSWNYLHGFYGKDWIWSTVPNFGGRTALKGQLDFYLNGHLEALGAASKGNLSGFGTSPEGVENNEILYELISAAGWSSERIDLDSFLATYTAARYGAAPKGLLDFWKELRQSVYANFTNNARFLWQQRPAYHRGETMEINEHYFRGIEAFLSESRRFKGNEAYEADAVQYAALYLAAKADYLLKQANWALVAGDKKAARKQVKKLYRILADADALLESHPILRMQRWLDMATAFATSEDEAELFRKEARRLVSTWSGPSLHDYSSRVWSGLIRDYYIPRLKNYYDAALRGEYVSLPELDEQYHASGMQELSKVRRFRHPVRAAKRLVRKWSSVRYESGKQYVPEHEAGYWCPQDFAGKDRKRLYLSIMADDFATINGLAFTHTSGAGKLVKVEFRSGSVNIGSVEVDEDLSQGSFRVPFPGPGTNAGLQREVAVYLTLTGGPDSYGMVSLY
ncbi:MAG: alpha-N-acetylglucosaminidase C-terminal domain-containing protein [Bacteroidales bacterium]|nr:alpha-N-acetylglucosaminidase C-terminal domain-containing protein [Bacteroidales bacterium]